jgi:hypothetical protein
VVNWYKFKVELSAWVYKVGASVLSTLVILRVWFQPEGGVRYYPVSLRLLAENEWIIQSGFMLAVLLIWVCYWRIFSIYRGRRAYRER